MQNAPFFVAKLCRVLSFSGHSVLFKSLFFSKGIAMDRLVGFQDLGAKDDFTTKKLENILVIKG